MKATILTELITEANDVKVKSKGTLRIGQCMWNTFESYFFNHGTPEQNKKFQDLRSTDVDPFYNDKMVDRFIQEVSRI